MQRLKLTREFISSCLKENIPEFEEILVFFEQNGGWINMPPKMIEMTDRLKVHNYPVPMNMNSMSNQSSG